MRLFLISALLLGLVAGCSSVNIGPHRIDVQQGNALDQENVARLKPGLNRSQVRFLLGTPLVVDPFRTDRWDYVYVYYKAGKLAEQKRITLFFEGDILARIEGDLPEPAQAQQSDTLPVLPRTKVETVAAPAVEPPKPVTVPKAELVSQPVSKVDLETVSAVPAEKVVKSDPAPVSSVQASTPEPLPKPVARPTDVKSEVKTAVVTPKAPAEPAPRTGGPETSVVAPLPSPKNVPVYVDPRPVAELSLQPETNVAQLKPDVIPPFPETQAVAIPSEDAVLKSLDDWASAWARRDEEAYLAAYDASFVPQGGGSRSDWEKRRRLLLGLAKNIDLKIDSPSVDRGEDGAATVTFNQIYRSDSYRDSVVKQMRMVERDGRWLIVEEKVLSILRGARK